jgi:predicted neutral ceramidase superfamily lipid hydrolase
MFRSFLIDWLEGKNDELESYLNELGIQTEIDVAAYVFRRKATKQVKSIMLISNFHPGPFLNVGSSVLPFLFQTAIRKRLGAIGMVPHGVSGHELNLVSQEQNAKVIEWVIEKISTASYSDNATPVVRVRSLLRPRRYLMDVLW